VKCYAAMLLAALALAGCQEKLTAPADCPALCPGGQPQIFDEVFTAIPGADSSYAGYIQPFQARSLLVSNGLEGFEERALVRFLIRADSVSVRDTLRGYTIDSVALSFTVAARDANVNGLELWVYRIAPGFDSSTTFAGVAPAFVPESLIAAVPVPDTLNTGVVRTVFAGADLSRIQMSPADSGRLAVGIRLSAPTFTGVRLGAVGAGAGALFTTYATLDVPDTGTAKLRTLALSTAFNTYVSEMPQVSDTTLLALGGAPSSRSLLRFSLPPRILDSATIVRATLELTPTAPISGLPTDTVLLEARSVLADVGAKSPVNIQPNRVALDTLELGSTTVSIEAVQLMQLWLGSNSPSALVLALNPEGASFTKPVFYSTRAADPALRPRLRLSYLLAFPFESP
jgi:hypothetical protein